MSLLSLNRRLDAGKVFLCLFCLGYHQSCFFLFFQQLSNVSLQVLALCNLEVSPSYIPKIRVEMLSSLFGIKGKAIQFDQLV